MAAFLRAIKNGEFDRLIGLSASGRRSYPG
jgi:hypothetical protein